MQNTLGNPLANLDVSKARLFLIVMLGYLGLYVVLGSMESGDPELILSMNPIVLLGAQALTSGVFFLLLPYLFWRYRLKLSNSDAFQKIDLISIGYVFLIALSMMFIISVIGSWNLNIDLPDSAFEDWAQSKEAELKVLTEHMINFTGIGHFLGSILIIALLPAIGEELIFRGIIQNLISRLSNNPHLAIWISAVLFSAIHLQFYGFFPRVLLGALFGYLYFWSGRLSVAMLAHFFNNGIALCLAYVAGQGWIEASPEELDQAAPWPTVVVFLILGIFVLIKFKRHYSHGNWQKVFRDRQEHRASIVKDVLIDREIEAVLVNKKDSLYGFGYFEVQVSSNDVILAIKIIQEEINFE